MLNLFCRSGGIAGRSRIACRMLGALFLGSESRKRTIDRPPAVVRRGYPSSRIVSMTHACDKQRYFSSRWQYPYFAMVTLSSNVYGLLWSLPRGGSGAVLAMLRLTGAVVRWPIASPSVLLRQFSFNLLHGCVLFSDHSSRSRVLEGLVTSARH